MFENTIPGCKQTTFKYNKHNIYTYLQSKKNKYFWDINNKIFKSVFYNNIK